MLKHLWRRVRLAYYNAALAQIDLGHPDIPYIVQRITELQKDTK